MNSPIANVDHSAHRLEWPLALVFAAVLFNCVLLWPELQSALAPSQNDTLFHALMITEASAAAERGSSLVDFWIPQLEFGFPQFLHYQHLPHLLIVGLHRALGGSVELLTLLHVVRWLLLVTFPLTVYWSARRLEMDVRAAAVAAAASSLISGDARFGFEYNSYIWRGFGMYTQLWAMHLSFVALACLHRTMRDGKGYAQTIIVLAAIALSQLLYAWMTAISAVLLLVVGSNPRGWVVRAARLAVVGVPAVLIASYMIVPFLTMNEYLSTFPVLPGTSGGPAAISAGWMSTDVLDHQRWPVLTLMLLVGIVITLLRVLRERSRTSMFLAAGFAVWMLLCFGGDRIAPLLRLVGLYGADISYRFLGSVELFAILLMGAGGGWLWDRLSVSQRDSASFSGRFSKHINARAVAGGALIVLWFAPALAERARYYQTNARWIHETAEAVRSDTDLQGILAVIEAGDGGRLYAGRRDNWGANLMVGPVIRVSDVIKSRGIQALVPPYQGLSLNTDMVWRFDDANAAHYNMFDVRHVIVPAGSKLPAFMQPYIETGRYAAYSIATTGAAMWVSVAERAPIATQLELLKSNRAWLASDAPTRRSFTRWDYPALGSPDAQATVSSISNRCAQTGLLSDVHADADSIVVRVSCEDQGTLMFKSGFHPNWRVSVDGSHVPAFMVSPAFLAAEIAAGEHIVKAEYRASTGKHVLLLAGAVVLLAVLFARDRLDAPARRLATAAGVVSAFATDQTRSTDSTLT